jgi:isochorismate synthase EntC
MLRGKLAGLACVQLDEHLRCRLFGRPERPAVCVALRPTAEMCGATREQAIEWLSRLEKQTAPDAKSN